MMESKLNEYNTYKEKSEKKKAELQQIINEKNSKIESKNKIIEDDKKKLNEEMTKYSQLNNEYHNLLKQSKEVKKFDSENNNTTGARDVEIRQSFTDLYNLLTKYKEIVPFLNKKLENEEKENKNLKEQINKMNNEQNKNKEIEDLKNEINKLNSDKDNLMKDYNLLKTENNLIKNDIILIGNSMNKNVVNNNLEQNNDEKNSNSLNEIMNQLMKARNIISFLLKEK